MSCEDCPQALLDGSSPVQQLGWRCWTDDGRCYCSKSNAWSDVPDDGIVMMMVYLRRSGQKQTEQRVLQASYYFVMPQKDRPPLIFGSEEMPAEIAARYPGAIIKRGRLTDDEMFWRIEEIAMTSTW
jgi:hypothetical protein